MKNAPNNEKRGTKRIILVTGCIIMIALCLVELENHNQIYRETLNRTMTLDDIVNKKICGYTERKIDEKGEWTEDTYHLIIPVSESCP